MSNFICTVNGTRGRNLDLYDNKCVIKTDVSLESLMTRNANDDRWWRKGYHSKTLAYSIGL